MTLGQRIKQFRTDNKITLKEFAARAGISVAYVSLLETGRQTHGKKVVPSIQVYYNCADAMGMSIDDLVKQLDQDEAVSIIPNRAERERYDRMSEIQAVFDSLPEDKQMDVLAYAKWKLDSGK